MKIIHSILLPIMTLFSLELNAETMTEKLLERAEGIVLQSDEEPEQAHIHDLLLELKERRFVKYIGNEEMRNRFVKTQALIEYLLGEAKKEGETPYSIGVIHTPKPATPLCQPLDKRLVPRLLCSHQDGLNHYLNAGGKLFAVYPENGLYGRSEDQQKNYIENITRYSPALIDWPIPYPIPLDLVGATFLFTDHEGIFYSFSILGNQLGDPNTPGEWEIWFGEVDHPEVSLRIEAVIDFLDRHDGPDLTSL